MKTIVNALPIGTVLDSGQRKYRIVKVLGQGGFGITYQAVAKIKVGNVMIDAMFAIKEHYVSSFNMRQGTMVVLTNPNNAQEVDDSLSTFMAEAERLNRLSISHSGLVSVNECFRTNDTAYYVMEYVGGQNLRQTVEAMPGHRMSEQEALALIGKVADAVDYLHQNQVTHLDIKPDNILLRDDGTPVLIDFGLAKHYDRQGQATSVMKVAGCSDGYAPMEQYLGIDHFAPEADVYAVAATLLYLLTGHDPRKASEISASQISQSLPAEVSETTRSAIVHAMQKIGEMRTKSVGLFVDELGLRKREDANAKNETEPEGGTVTRVQKPAPRASVQAEPAAADEEEWEETSSWYSQKTLMAVAGVVLLVGLAIFLFSRGGDKPETETDESEYELMTDDAFDSASEKEDEDYDADAALLDSLAFYGANVEDSIAAYYDAYGY